MTLLGMRCYTTDTGRFMTPDPIRDGSNWYAYADSSPLRYVDPDGLFCTTVTVTDVNDTKLELVDSAQKLEQGIATGKYKCVEGGISLPDDIGKAPNPIEGKCVTGKLTAEYIDRMKYWEKWKIPHCTRPVTSTYCTHQVCYWSETRLVSQTIGPWTCVNMVVQEIRYKTVRTYWEGVQP